MDNIKTAEHMIRKHQRRVLYERICDLVLDNLGIIHAVKACEAVADQINAGLQSTQRCYDPRRCAMLRCGECGR